MRPLYTVEEAQEHLENWKQAERALATGQSYSIAGRSLTRVNLADVMTQINYWRKRLQEAEDFALGIRRPGKSQRIVPYD